MSYERDVFVVTRRRLWKEVLQIVERSAVRAREVRPAAFSHRVKWVVDWDRRYARQRSIAVLRCEQAHLEEVFIDVEKVVR